MLFWKRMQPQSSVAHQSLASPISFMDALPGEPVHSRRSYSQSGEDMLVAYLAHTLRLDTFTYLDIGAYSPTHLSNTNFFYERGYRGVCIEANPDLARVYTVVRPLDRVLNVAISADFDGEAPFYVLSEPTLSTLSKLEAERLVAEEGVSQVNTIALKVRSIGRLLRSEFSGRNLNFVSLDVEGLDIEIMRKFDFEFVKPEILCLETLEYKKSGPQRKNAELIELVVGNGYAVYADTQINTIFVDKNKWHFRY